MKISERIIDEIKSDLKENHSELYLSAFTNLDEREVLKRIVQEQHKTLLNDEEKVNHVIQEIVGLGIIDDIVNKDPDVTDIGYNASKLIIETPNEKYEYQEELEEDYIEKIIQKFANAVGKEFTPKNPILDAALGNLRISATHKVNSPYGTTMSIRVSRPKLALREENFEDFAPIYMLDFFKAAVKTRCNIVISGEVGTGKTELQKFLTSFIPFDEKIGHIEDVQEGHVKELFPDKDIISWLVTPSVSYSTLIKAMLRNNPVWINIAETREREAYEMIQAVLSGHHIITTTHAVNARTIPTRLVNMAKMGYQVDEKALMNDIFRYFQFGIHIKKKKIKGRTVRFLSEVVEYMDNGQALTVFEVEENNDEFIYKVGNYSSDFEKRLLEYGSSYKGLPLENRSLKDDLELINV